MVTSNGPSTTLPEGLRRLLRRLADLLRGAVRCAVPLFLLGAFAALLFCDQGRDVMRALVERAAPENGNSLGGLVFLAVGSTALSLSLWYSMRWLLTAEMRSLPLRSEPGMFRSWLPRVVGAAVPALVALDLYGGLVPASHGAAPIATQAGHAFSALAVVLLVFYWRRGRLLQQMQARGWMVDARGRHAGRPGVIGEDEELPALTLRIIVWSTVLSGLVALLVMLFPLTLPRVIGAAGAAALALASLNLFGSFVLTYWPLRNGVPHLGPWAILYAGLIGSCNDNHIVQPAAGADAQPVQRISVAADFESYLKRLDPAGRTDVPVLFVASEGGGIRAAYWTAAVLEELRRRMPDMERSLYAVSGVSGGSVGLTAWLVARRSATCAGTAGRKMPAATESLGMDFVSPAIAGLLYYDLLQRFIPVTVAAWDRSRALEEGWQRAFSHAPDRPMEATIEALYDRCESLPHLMLNSTVVETGQRAVLTRLETNPAGADPILIDHFDAMDARYTTRRQSLAGLAHHSARFPVVSPAGTVEELTSSDKRVSAFRLVDGGYFDNSGVQTTMELIAYLQRTSRQPFRPVLVLVRNAPDSPGCEGPCTPGTGAVFPEVASMIGALFAVRGAHAVSARQSADRLLHEPVIDLVVGKGTPAARAPLGWSLSASVKRALDAEAVAVATGAAAELHKRYGWKIEVPR